MGYELYGGKKKNGLVLLQGEQELFFNKILSRNSSVGYSSRIYYHRSTGEGVPFQWEMQPGTPKDPPKEEAVPPLSPPPAILSLGLPKPCIPEEPKSRSKLRLPIRFWKKSKKNKNFPMIQTGSQANNNENSTSCFDKDERFDFCSSDREFMASPLRNSSSSSSSSLSFQNGFSRQSSRLQSPAWHPPNKVILGCSPWNIRAILVGMSKRV